MVDIEADGPIHGEYSMVSIGAVPVGRHAELSFYGQTRPVHQEWNHEALAVSGFTRDQHLVVADPACGIREFAEWVEKTAVGRPVMVSDNPAYDWQFVNGYLWKYAGRNPFGHSARRIGDLYAGMQQGTRLAGDWRRLRKTPHTHHPVDDARGVAEALVAMKALGLDAPF